MAQVFSNHSGTLQGVTLDLSQPGNPEDHRAPSMKKTRGRESTAAYALAAKYLRGLGDPTRLTILQLLTTRGEMNVSQLVEALGDIPQGRLSDHLACLKWCNYVASRREGRFIYYFIKDARVLAILELVRGLATENAAQIEACPRLMDE